MPCSWHTDSIWIPSGSIGPAAKLKCKCEEPINPLGGTTILSPDPISEPCDAYYQCSQGPLPPHYLQKPNETREEVNHEPLTCVASPLVEMNRRRATAADRDSALSTKPQLRVAVLFPSFCLHGSTDQRRLFLLNTHELPFMSASLPAARARRSRSVREARFDRVSQDS